jgi:hypothetical protein
MGLFDRIFKTRKDNFFEQIVNEIANEEKSKDLLKSPFLKGRHLVLNRDGILSFVIAVFCFEWAFNTKLKDVKFNKEVLEMVLKENKSEAYELFFYTFYKLSQIPNNTHVLWEVTYAYLKIVWGIEDKIRDPILLTAYSVYLTQVRVGLKQRIEESLPDLIQFNKEISSKEPDIEKFLEDFYLLAYESLGRKEIKDAIDQCKLESKQEGTDNLPDNFGDFLIEQAKGNNEKYLKIVNNAILGGANDDDIRQWWNLNDLERRMMLWEDKIHRTAAFLSLKETKGMSDQEAISQIRKTYALYGNPTDETNTQGEDRPLPNELHNTINQLTKELDVRQLINFSSMNAFLRSELARRKSNKYL